MVCRLYIYRILFLCAKQTEWMANNHWTMWISCKFSRILWIINCQWTLWNRYNLWACVQNTCKIYYNIYPKCLAFNSKLNFRFGFSFVNRSVHFAIYFSVDFHLMGVHSEWSDFGWGIVLICYLKCNRFELYGLHQTEFNESIPIDTYSLAHSLTQSTAPNF